MGVENSIAPNSSRGGSGASCNSRATEEKNRSPELALEFLCLGAMTMERMMDQLVRLIEKQSH